MEIPKEIIKTAKKLTDNNFQAYLVGGCVRDSIRKITPQDWDIATNATPDKIMKIFPESFSENKFGTVTLLRKECQIEITPFRLEAKYSDKRHPDKISWAKTIEEDLSRRDFTVNAMAINLSGVKKSGNFEIIDLFGGIKDLDNKIIKAVGNPEERFSEDGLRLMRAIRFAVTLDQDIVWQIEEKTGKAIKNNSHLLSFISKERIRDELVKIIISPNGARGIEILRRYGLLKEIIPELEEGFAVGQNKHHIYQIYQHSLLSLDYACQKNFPKEVRFAALLHDIAKPRTKRGEGLNSTFYNHEVVGAKMTEKIMRRLKFPNKEIEKVVRLVRYHLFYYNVGEVSETSVRRLLRNVGKENMNELLMVRQADRIGSGVPKAEPYKLRHLRYIVEKVLQDPISPKMLKIKGDEVMKLLNIPPGPRIGKILTCLLGETIKDPKKNNREYLKKRVIELGQKMSEQELDRTFVRTKKELSRIETKKDEMTKKKYWVN